MLGSLLSSYLSNKPIGNRVLRFLELLNLQQLNIPKQLLILASVSMVSIFLRMILSIYIQAKILRYFAKIASELSEKIFASFADAKFIKKTRFNNQEIIYATLDNTNTLVNNFFGSLTFLLSDAILLTIIFVGLFFVDYLSLAVIIVLFISTGFILHKLTRATAITSGRRQSELYVEIRDLVNSLLLQYREINVLNLLIKVKLRFNTLNSNYYKTLGKARLIPISSRYIWEGISISLLIFIGVIQFSQNDLTRAVGNLAIFLGATLRIIPGAVRIQNSFYTLRMSMAQSRLTLNVINESRKFQRKNLELEVAKEIKFNFTPTLEVNGLEFQFEDSPKKILKGINLNLKPGEFVGIIGESGVGKSTLVDLILGILEPSAGIVAISNVKPETAMKIWPGRISYVSQNIYLSSQTLKNNLFFGLPEEFEVTENKILEIIDQVELGKFLKDLPDGLNTLLKENGASISGGQRQRIGLARALMNNPQILILDEVTSSLDEETEKQISKLLNTFKGTKTILAISHKFNTLKYADKIFELKDGYLLQK